jgi:hypothetical protein
MTEKKVPKAWLPIDKFETPEEMRFLEMFTELIATGLSFSTRFLLKSEAGYELILEARITQTRYSPGEVDIILFAGNGYRDLASVDELNARGYKANSSQPTYWKRTMPGTPAAHIVANYLFSGIKHLVGFNTKMMFIVSTATNQGQKALDSIINKGDMTVDRDWGSITL